MKRVVQTTLLFRALAHWRTGALAHLAQSKNGEKMKTSLKAGFFTGTAITFVLCCTLVASAKPAARSQSQNNLKTSIAPGTATKPPTPTGANMSQQQQQNIAKLAGDLKALQAGMNAEEVAKYKAAVKADLEAIVANGVTRPAAGSVQKLANDLVAALTNTTTSPTGKPLTVKEKDALAAQVAAVLSSAGISSAEASQLVSDASNLLAASNLNKADAQLIAADLKAIADELYKNVSTKAGTAKSSGAPKRQR